MSLTLPVTDAAGTPFFGDLLGLLLPGKNARGTRICRDHVIAVRRLHYHVKICFDM